MKYLKTYESYFNFNIDIFTIKEASEFYYSNFSQYDLKNKLHYFYYEDFSTTFTSDSYEKSCRLIIAYTDADILGICKFANWDITGHYAISYLSVNENFFQKGISRKLLEALFKYFSETYPNKTLSFSGYSIDGWKYLRKNILEFSKKYNVKIHEKAIEYPGKNHKQDDKFYDIMKKSREEIEKLYGSSQY
jgi:hypothetical protein